MMKKFLRLLFNILWGSEMTSDLALENLALRQQLAIMKQSVKRPQLRSRQLARVVGLPFKQLSDRLNTSSVQDEPTRLTGFLFVNLYGSAGLDIPDLIDSQLGKHKKTEAYFSTCNVPPAFKEHNFERRVA
jgi:hypothetical protein